VGEFQKSLRDWTKLVELNPKKTGKVYNSRGYIYNKLEMYAEAIQQHTMAIKLDDSDSIAFKYPFPRSALTLCHSNRGFALNSLGRLAEAVVDYTRAIELDPKYAIAYNNRGFALQWYRERL
jgi:tetratricopeptide (TPR) repeat protein